jgi:hypothetical protein
MSRKIAYLFTMFSIILMIPFSALWAEENDSSGFGFTTTIGLGAKTFNETVDGEITPVTYSMIRFAPDISFGKVGIGLDFTLHYKDGFEIREEDWVPEGDRSFLDLYLPIFRYIRYGEKGDPLYGKIGSIDDGTLGNGFLMRNYSNTLFLPERRIIGLALDMDGSLFNFPYLGFETFTGNLARFDVFGFRVFARPAAATEIPIVRNLQIGSTYVADFETLDSDTVSMFGVDFIQPLLGGEALSLAFFGDLAFQTGGDATNAGGMLGFGGRLIGFINYGANLLMLGDNFLPFYFDATYDLYREAKYAVYSGQANVDGYVGWLASLGFTFLENALVFSTSVDGSFSPDGSSPETKAMTYPHLRSTLVVAEDLLPGFFFDAFYDKRAISGFDDFADPKNATIGANINYKTGPAVITLGYNLRYVPEDGSWETSSRLTSAITF